MQTILNNKSTKKEMLSTILKKFLYADVSIDRVISC